jgi:hypothetical protein
VGDLEDDEVQRVGGRRRLRPEILLVLGAVIFLAAALIKPWPGPKPKPSASIDAATQTVEPAQIAAQSGAPVMNYGPSPVGWPNVQSWDYGWILAGNGPLPGATNLPSTPAPTPRLPVDWSVLAAAEPHNGWGFGTALVPQTVPKSAMRPVLTPITSWDPTDVAPFSITIDVAPGIDIYALSVTWPSDIKVTGVTFGYVAGPNHPPYLPPPGFQAYTQTAALPAVQIASPSPAAKPATGASSLGSGQYWIPPARDGLPGAPQSIRNAWRTHPWAWPGGIYTVDVATTGGVRHLLLTINPT